MASRAVRGLAVAVLALFGHSRAQAARRHQTPRPRPSPSAASDSGPAPLRLGVIPSLSRDRMEAELEPVARWIGDRIGRRIELSYASDYADIASKIRQHEVEFAILFPLAYAQARESDPPVELLGCSVRQGKPNYRGYVITRGDSEVHSLAGLRGKTIAFVDRRSTSGFLYPLQVLEEAGLVHGDADFERFFGKVEFLGSHAAVVEAVATGKVDAGTVYDLAIRESTAQGVGGGGSLRILARTAPIPHEAVVARADIDPELRESFRKALLSLDTRSPEGRAVLHPMTSALELNGFVDCDPSTFDPVRRLLDRETDAEGR